MGRERAAWPGLGMIGIDFQVSKQKRLAAWLLAPAIRFNGYEYRVNLSSVFGSLSLRTQRLFAALSW